MRQKISILLILLLFCVNFSYAQEESLLRGIVDLHSDISDGISSLEFIAKEARDKGISVLVFADCALRRWEYGIWPLRNLVKKTVEENSVMRLGINKYLQRVTSLESNFPGLIALPGLEVYPLYCWKGSPLSKNCSLEDYYRQFLIFGLKAKDYQRLPIVGNTNFSLDPKNAFLLLWPVMLAIAGFWIMPRLRLILVTAGVLFLLNNIYLPASRFNQYDLKQGMRPYQQVIDYVKDKGGMIFWAHPEMESLQKYKGIRVYTAEHPEALLLTKGYTGFGITFTDRLSMVDTGGIWDELLLEYAGGRREDPAWIIGSLHYDGISRRIDELETIFFVKEKTQEGILKAMKEGKCYVRFNLGKEPLLLREFKVEIAGNNFVRIIIKGAKGASSELTKIELIRNGKPFRSFEEPAGVWEIITEDTLSSQESQTYYRLKITDSSTLIFSNPIFVANAKE